MIRTQDVETGEIIETPDEPFSPLAPAEVAMHRVQKAMILTPWPEESPTGTLLEAVNAAIDSLTPPYNALARIEFEKAPNLVRTGATTLQVMGIIGMSEAQRDTLLLLAQSLP